jgi:hypothetical protein
MNFWRQRERGESKWDWNSYNMQDVNRFDKRQERAKWRLKRPFQVIDVYRINTKRGEGSVEKVKGCKTYVSWNWANLAIIRHRLHTPL